MTFSTRNHQHAHRISESTAETMKQLWAAVIDQAVMDSTTRGEAWYDAIDFLLRSDRSDMHLAIVGLDPDGFRKHLVAAMSSPNPGRINPNRRRTFMKNLNEYNDRTRQPLLF